jgi:hypothetical protein
VWTIITNDKLRVLRFLQKRGFSIVSVYRNAVLESQGLVAGIPISGEHGIPIRDQLELEVLVNRHALPSTQVNPFNRWESS